MSTLLTIRDLKTYFPITEGMLGRTVAHVKAVDGVNLTIDENEILGLVGESGCGKSTLGRSIVRLVEPTSGSIEFRNTNLLSLRGEALRHMRRNLQIIFQDPASSLNPRMTIGESIAEPLQIHRICAPADIPVRVADLLARVGLQENSQNRYPHEFSGGQCQRVGMARALALNPSLLIADEPVSALDVSIQSQIITLLLDLKAQFNLSYLFISHDLGVVRYIADRIAVMYLGRIVEIGPSELISGDPKHPYTQALISAIPQPSLQIKKQRIILSGDVPSPAHPPSGCTFHTRCPMARPECSHDIPVLRDIGGGRSISCPWTS